MSARYAAITAHRATYPVHLMCAALDVSPSGYYAAVRRAAAPPSAHALRVQRRVDVVRTLFVQCRQRYGAPRLHLVLRARGERIAKKAVARILQAAGLAARRPTAFVRTTQADPGEPVVPNRLARRFALRHFDAPNQAWVGDMTYIPTHTGWLYLAVLLDLATRKIVGWAVGPTLETRLPLTALQRALAWEAPPVGLLHHTDRGGQYASLTYRDALTTAGAVASMSRTGDCWDNAVAESFFATLEHELLAHHHFTSHRDATQALTDYLQWYNAERLHSTLGYVCPTQYDRQLRHSTRAA